MHQSSRQWWAAAVLAAAALGAAPARAAAQAADAGVIEGRVTDASSRRPVPGVQVLVVNTTAGAVTGPEGTFRILSVTPGARRIRTRLIGYAPSEQAVTVTAGQTATANLEIRASAIELNAVVVTGTGSAIVEERKLGNTVGIIRPPANAPVQSFSEVLQGREPGVVGLPSSGLAGEGARIRIRGNASLSQSNEPIVYVDGVRIDNGGGFGQGFVGTGGGGRPSRLDDIDPTTIDRVEILKGAAAATLYGTEASNGVIQIFTKRGASGAPRWQFNAERAASNYLEDRIEDQYGFARRQGQADSLSVLYGRTITPFEVISQPFAKRLFETGESTTLSGQVNGGTPIVDYFLSGRYISEDGPFGGSYFSQGRPDAVQTADLNRKYQGTLSVGLAPSSRLKVNARALYADSHNEVPENNNSIYAPYTLALFSQPQRANCRASAAGANDPTLGVASPGRCLGAGNPTGSSTFASIYESLQRSITQDARHFNGVFTTDYTPLTALRFNGQVGLDFTTQRSVAFLPFGNNVDLVTAQANNGDRDVSNRQHQEVTLNGNGTWTADITSRLQSTFLFGGQGFFTNDEEESSSNQEFPGPGIENVGAGSVPQAFEFSNSVVNAGFFAQEQLDFSNWIFTTIGARYDYNSAFGQNSNGVLYPKVSLSVVPSDREGWNKNVLSTFRLRSAIGRAGRQPGAFDQFTTYGALVSGTGSGLVPLNLGNADLEPEVSTEWEVGAELGFLGDRAAIEFTRWDRKLSDALIARQFPPSGGFYRLQLDNVGEMKAFGWELGLRGLPVTRQNLSIDVFANTAFLSQVVTSLGGAPALKVGGSYVRYRNFIAEGYAPGSLFGAALPGACRAGQTKTAGGGRCLQAGQLPFDTNGDGIPDTEAQLAAFLAKPVSDITQVDPIAADDDNDGNLLDHYLGKPTPDFTGSFGGTMNFLGSWRVNTLFEFKAGRYTITDLTGAFRRSSPTNGGNTRARAEVESVLLNPASTAEQRVAAAKTYAYELRGLTPYDGLNQNFSGDFLRWRELSLTYTVPSRLAQRAGTRDLAVTLSGRNLQLWTKYPGADPEINVFSRSGAGGTDNNFGDAIDAFGLPLPRRIAFSISAGF